MSKKGSDPDRISRQSASIFGLGLGEAHKTTIHKGGATYSGKGTTKEAADKAAGDNYRKGIKD